MGPKGRNRVTVEYPDNNFRKQLETTLKDTVTFDTLAARLTGMKTVNKRRVKWELSPEEKAAFHARLVKARRAKEKLDWKLPRLKQIRFY